MSGEGKGGLSIPLPRAENRCTSCGVSPSVCAVTTEVVAGYHVAALEREVERLRDFEEDDAAGLAPCACRFKVGDDGTLVRECAQHKMEREEVERLRGERDHEEHEKETVSDSSKAIVAYLRNKNDALRAALRERVIVPVLDDWDYCECRCCGGRWERGQTEAHSDDGCLAK